ncbi:unnamed protein product [Effrenium voratum]|nr:unnamed protein product [Effrenium voratum]
MDLVDHSPFLVRTSSASDLFFLPAGKLHALAETYPEDLQRLEERCRKLACGLLRSWVRRFHSRCCPRLFSYASQEFLSAFVELMHVRLYRAEATICREGEPGNWGFYLHTGRMRVTKSGVEVSQLFQDGRAWQSWWGMLEVGSTCVEQTCTVTAESDCIAWVLQTRDAEELRSGKYRECRLLDKVAIRHLELLNKHMDAMRSIAMFADCGKDFLEVLKGEFAQRLCARDEVVFKESELGEEMFVLALGKCKVLRSGSDRPVSRLHPGSVFGGHAVLGISQTRKETVMADTVCDLRALSRKALLRVLERFPEEEDRILAIVEAHGESRKAASLALAQASAAEGGFSQDFIRMLVDNMYEQPFMVNQAILQQGTPGTHLVVLVHGMVEIEANGMVVATVNAPGIFGERGLLVSGSRSGATVRATTVAECMMLPVDGPSTPVIRQLYEQDMKTLERMLQKKMASTVQRLATEKGSNLPTQQSTSFLKNCDPSFLTRMAQHFEKQVFLPGQNLVEKGYDAGFCFLIQQGEAIVEIDGRLIKRLMPGEFLGELVALGFAEVATATVRAETRMLTFAINNTAFREVVDEFPEEKQKLLDLIQQRPQVEPRRRGSRTFAAAVMAVSSMNSARREREEKAVQPVEEGMVETFQQEVKRLPGYRSGMSWVRQRRAALEDASYLRMMRSQMRPQDTSSFAPVLPPPSTAPMAAAARPGPPPGPPPRRLRQAQAAASVSGEARLKKSQRVYGRKVWLETCQPRSAPNQPNESEADPTLEEEDCLGPLDNESVSSEPKDRFEQLSPRLTQHLAGWFGEASGEEAKEPDAIAQLSSFLQQEEELAENERKERSQTALARIFRAWDLAVGGAADCERPSSRVEELDYCEGGDAWREMEAADCVTDLLCIAIRSGLP